MEVSIRMDTCSGEPWWELTGDAVGKEWDPRQGVCTFTKAQRKMVKQMRGKKERAKAPESSSSSSSLSSHDTSPSTSKHQRLYQWMKKNESNFCSGPSSSPRSSFPQWSPPRMQTCHATTPTQPPALPAVWPAPLSSTSAGCASTPNVLASSFSHPPVSPRPTTLFTSALPSSILKALPSISPSRTATHHSRSSLHAHLLNRWTKPAGSGVANAAA